MRALRLTRNHSPAACCRHSAGGGTGAARRGFSLFELLIVLSLLGVLAGMVLPSANPSILDRLNSAARMVASDVAYCRSLAVMNNSQYSITFEAAKNRYVITHSGSDTTLDTLPTSYNYRSDDPPNRHTAEFATMPGVGATVRLLRVASADSGTAVSQLEFGPLGETTQAEATVIWLAAGAGPARRYITITVNPITSLARISPLLGSGP
jgi:prepilin-type N-terminal cleavage/methylation domain-containing protein